MTITEKFKPYPKYKDSGVEWLGEIPEGWDVKKLKFVTRFAYGNSLASEDRNEGDVNVYGSNGIVGSHTLSNTKGPCLIIGRKGSFGKITFSEKPCFAIDTTYFVDSLGTKHNIRWLYYLLLTLRLDAISKDSAVPGLSREDAYGNYLPSCKNEEQTQIAEFLDHETSRIDSLIEMKNRQIELLQEKRSALITHAVTKGLNPNAKMKDSGVAWIGEIPEGWEIFSIKHLLKNRKDAIKTGPFGSQLLSSEMMAGDIKVYNQRNVLDNDFESGENYISYEKYTELKAFRIFPDDLLITTRGTIGKCAIFPNNASEGILHPCLMRIQVDSKKILHKYLSIIIQESSIVRTNLQLLSNATTIDVIYSDSLKSVKMPIPTISEQIQIAQFLEKETSKIDTLISKIQFSIDKLTEFRTALISAAVTGKIDVRNEACI